MKRLFRELHCGKRGFTLIELLVVIAITGLIGTGITMSIFQVVKMNDSISCHMIAITQVENAGYWITRDALMAQSIIADAEALTLAWVGWEYQCASNRCVNTYEVCYEHTGTELCRHQTITTDKYDSSGYLVETTPSQNSMLVAENIIAITPSMDGNKLTVSINASVGEIEEKRTYEITPRAKPNEST